MVGNMRQLGNGCQNCEFCCKNNGCGTKEECDNERSTEMQILISVATIFFLIFLGLVIYGLLICYLKCRKNRIARKHNKYIKKAMTEEDVTQTRDGIIIGMALEVGENTPPPPLEEISLPHIRIIHSKKSPRSAPVPLRTPLRRKKRCFHRENPLSGSVGTLKERKERTIHRLEDKSATVSNSLRAMKLQLDTYYHPHHRVRPGGMGGMGDMGNRPRELSWSNIQVVDQVNGGMHQVEDSFPQVEEIMGQNIEYMQDIHDMPDIHNIHNMQTMDTGLPGYVTQNKLMAQSSQGSLDHLDDTTFTETHMITH